MKIKRFFAADIRQAMRMVKDELGSDAVIMSNKSVDGGVEIFAARDFDPQVLQSKSQDEEKSTSQKAIKKLFELPNYAAEKANLHIVSSPRKQAAVEEKIQRPARREADHYIGYAEKAMLARPHTGHIEAPVKLSAKKPVDMPPIMDVDFTDEKYSASKIREKERIASHPAKSIEPKLAPTIVQNVVEPDLLEEMRREFKRLNFSMAARLSEVSYVNTLHSNPVRLDLLNRLANMGISKKLSLKLANRLETEKTGDAAFKKAQKLLAKLLPVTDESILDQGGVIALVGPTGVGKTTTIAKLAAKFILKHGPRQVALITTDNFRIAAHEQLTTYARILDVPVRSAANAEELRTLINGFFDKKLILIDTAGMAPKDMRLVGQLMTLQEHDIQVKSYLVMSATTQYKAMQSIIKAFQIVGPAACIITKMDEAESKGAVISTLIEQQLPVAFITDGQQVPEDIQVPHAQRLIEQCATELDLEYDNHETLGYDDWVMAGYA